ncbi:MAG: DUF192 domain-containing protein [Candidatus Omnitrophica bacterium]|nr:DUF192 domain-containing protein [Candidatus Omnitrophota bacterium]
MLMNHSYFTIVCMIIALAAGCSDDERNSENSRPPGALGPLQTVEFELGGVTVEIEVAITQAEQMQGLMYRESMPENHGMLFVNEQPRYLSFWMKNTRIPLSIAFIRDDLVISNIENMKPQTGSFEPVERYHSRYKCLYALEINEGWFEQHGIKAGEKIDLPLEKIEQIASSKKQ